MSALTLRNLAASSAVVALAFASQAGAAGLIDDNRAILRYSGEFSSSLAAAAKDDVARLHARGFMTELESKLKSRTNKPLTAMYPTPVSPNQLFTAALVAPQGMEQADIPNTVHLVKELCYNETQIEIASEGINGENTGHMGQIIRDSGIYGDSEYISHA